MVARWLLVVSLAVGCGPAADVDIDLGPAADLPVDPVRALTRASLDLRGVRPTLAEIEAIEADPTQYEAMVDAFLEGPNLGARIRDLWAPVFLTQQEYWYIPASAYGIDDEKGFAEAVGQEPLRIVSHIIVNDLPFTDLVTGDWTMANELLGAAWPVDYPEGETGWQPVHYTDGRPAAGVLVSNAMWWRYLTNDSNLNRGRANALSRSLLCHDYLDKTIAFDRNVNLLDTNAVNQALKTNPGCVACHSTLDPLASYLFGFHHYDYDMAIDVTYYHPDRENLWSSYTGVAPGYYGQPGYGLADLGRQMAADPRFPECAAKRVFELFLDREPTLADQDALTELRATLLDNDVRMKPMIREVLLSDEYERGVDATGSVRRKMLSPAQLTTAIEDLTGFRFTSSGYDLLASDEYGVRTLAGGVDGQFATREATEPTATIVLVHERYAQAAAWAAAEHDRDHPDAARLFTDIAFTETTDTDHDAMVVQVQVLLRRVLGRVAAPDGGEVEALLSLWDDVHRIDKDKTMAWATVLSVLLRDPEFIFY